MINLMNDDNRDHYNAFALALPHSEGDLDALIYGLKRSGASMFIFIFNSYFQFSNLFSTLTSKVSGWVSMISRKTR